MRPLSVVHWCAIGLVLAAALPASAHDADIVYVHLEPVPNTPAIREIVTLTASALSELAPLDTNRDGQLTQAELDAGDAPLRWGFWGQVPLETVARTACARDAEGATLRDGYVELAAQWSCPSGELQQTFRILSVLPAGYRVVLVSALGGAPVQSFAEGNRQTVYVRPAGSAEQQPRVEGWMGWVRLGVFHIFTGYDHLAFLVALLLVGASVRRTLWMVTSFTVAHSITLAAAVLGWVSFGTAGSRAVEVLIALSIIWVAGENLILRSHGHRPWVTFAFGLIHGLGFASSLTSYGLGDSIAVGLFGFNVGVELGQGLLVAALLPVIRWAKRHPRLDAWMVRAGSAGVLAAGAAWLVARLIA